jgi:3-hydroxybutyrate dehydrogenase
MGKKTAFVAGAANGIGRRPALALEERGYRVIVCDISADEAAAVVREIESTCGTAVQRCCDVTRSDSLQFTASTVVAQFGAPELVISNVGVTVSKPVPGYSKEEWRWLLEVNLIAVGDMARIFKREALAAEKACHLVFTASEHSVCYPQQRKAPYTLSSRWQNPFAPSLRDALR